MRTQLIKLEIINKIMHIKLNNPQNQNTLSEDMIKQVNNALLKGSKNNHVKVIVLSSTGTVFCAGHNLKDLNSKRSRKDKGKKYYKKIFKSCSMLMMNIINTPKAKY